MMKIYRVEHVEHKIGPLCVGGSNITNKSWYEVARDHAAIQDINLKFVVEAYHKFGLTDVSHLFKIFKKSRWEFLLKNNFRLVEYIVKDYVIFDDIQVVYDSRTAERVDNES
jgi:hypothetical protein